MKIKNLNISQIIELEQEYVIIVVFLKDKEVLFDNFMGAYYKNHPTIKKELPVYPSPYHSTLVVIDRLPSNKRTIKMTTSRLTDNIEVNTFLKDPNNIIIENRKSRPDVKYIATIATEQTLEIEDRLAFLFGGDNND